MSIFIKVVDVETSRPGKPVFRTVERKPRGTYTVEGYQFELYPVSVLAEALYRGKHALIRWETAGKIPSPMYDLPESHYTKSDKPDVVCKPRWYSNHQIMNMHNVLVHKYRSSRKLKGDELVRFLDDLKKVFYLRKLTPVEELKTL